VNAQAQLPDSEAIQQWSIEYIAGKLDVPASQLDPAADVDSLGLDSTTAVAYIMSLEEWLGIELTPELLFEYPSITSLSGHLAIRVANGS
jgi:acyl carrier protein